jgi:hypothetical protein
MQLKFITPKEIDGTPKITVHKSGKLGFSRSAADLLDIENNKFCKFAYDEENERDRVLYFLIEKTNDGESFSISKAGDYYYIKAKSLLNDLGIDFSDPTITIIFDISPTEYEGQRIYKLIKRIINKNKKAS